MSSTGARYREARRYLAAGAVSAATLRIAAWYPDDATLELHNDEEGGWYWHAGGAYGDEIEHHRPG